MAQETINTGTTPNDNTGTLLRNAWNSVNNMMAEIYNKLFETGKVLSDNNYTTAEKNKLATLTDEVIEVANYAALPGTGTTGILYVTLDTGFLYRWTGSVYSEVSAGVALGETSTTAYRGDRGKTAYDHSQDSSVHVTTQNKTDLASVTLKTAVALTTGTKTIDLTNLLPLDYGIYDMASGALTLTPAANPVRDCGAHGIIIADATHVPNVTALCTGNIANPTVPLKGSFDNTNDAVNYWIAYYAMASDGNLKYFFEWKQAD